MKKFTETIPYNQEFIIIKPGFSNRTSQIEKDLFASGLKLVKSLTRQLTYDEAKKLYKPHEDKPFYKDLCKYMASGMSVGYLFDNPENVNMKDLKEGMRKIYGIDDMRNAIHSSDDQDAVKRESKIFFSKI